MAVSKIIWYTVIALLGIILISHDLHDVFELSDRLHVMKNGELVGSVQTKEVTQDGGAKKATIGD